MASPTAGCPRRGISRWPWATPAWIRCGSASGPARRSSLWLYARAIVAADEWLATRADDLALGAVVDALGPRAEDLGELWNAWGRIRTLLLATD